MKYFKDICIHHGETNFIKPRIGRPKCIKCKSAKHRIYRNKKRLLCIEYKGGKCEKCGNNKCTAALEFHHIEPNKKDFNISVKGAASKSIEELKIELDKCLLLCSNCHKELHANE